MAAQAIHRRAGNAGAEHVDRSRAVKEAPAQLFETAGDALARRTAQRVECGEEPRVAAGPAAIGFVRFVGSRRQRLERNGGRQGGAGLVAQDNDDEEILVGSLGRYPCRREDGKADGRGDPRHAAEHAGLAAGRPPGTGAHVRRG
jgi:hypothetical protein